MVENLSVGPYKFKVVPLFAGPLLEVAGEGNAVALLLNHAVAGTSDQLAKAIEEAKEGSDPIVYVLPATGDQELAQVGQAGVEDTVPISWISLRKGLADLRELRANWQPEPGPWLFVQPSLRPFVTPQDLEIVQQLESEAATIDELDLQAEVGNEAPSLISRRRSFLASCQNAGIFSTEHGEIIEQWLRNWSAQRLLALRNAAIQIRTWGISAQDEDPLNSLVTLDYVRLQLWPHGEDGKSWAKWGISLLDQAANGDQGAVVERVGNSLVRMWWRRDGTLPALLAIAQD